MRNCAAQFNYVDHPGYVPSFGEPLTYGSVDHALKYRLISGESKLNVLEASSVRGELFQILTQEYALPPPPLVYEAVEGLSEGAVAAFVAEQQVGVSKWYEEYWSKQPKDLPITCAEVTLYRPLGEAPSGRLVVLQGTPDLVTYKIVDHKTAARGWKFEKAQFTEQLPTYSALVEYNYGFLPLEGEFVVYNRQNGKIEVYETDRKEVHVRATLANAHLRGIQLDSKILPATPIVTEYFKDKRGWYCSPKYCPAWNPCEFKWLNDNVDESAERTMSWM